MYKFSSGITEVKPVTGYLQMNQTGENFNGESALDLQYAMSLVGPTQPVTLYQVDNSDQAANGTYLSLVNMIASLS